MKNSVCLIGNLGADPELRHTDNGVAVANFRIATNEFWNDKQGKRQERTEWHRIVVWGKNAINCAEHLSKGRLVDITGKLKTREWENRDGNKVQTTEIHAERVIFLPGGKRQNADQTVSAEEQEAPTVEVDPSVSEDAQQVFVEDGTPF